MDEDEYPFSSSGSKRPLSVPSTPDSITKKLRLEHADGNQHSDNDIPDYLQATNKCFNLALANYYGGQLNFPLCIFQFLLLYFFYFLINFT